MIDLDSNDCALIEIEGGQNIAAAPNADDTNVGVGTNITGEIGDIVLDINAAIAVKVKIAIMVVGASPVISSRTMVSAQPAAAPTRSKQYNRATCFGNLVIAFAIGMPQKTEGID